MNKASPKAAAKLTKIRHWPFSFSLSLSPLHAVSHSLWPRKCDHSLSWLTVLWDSKFRVRIRPTPLDPPCPLLLPLVIQTNGKWPQVFLRWVTISRKLTKRRPLQRAPKPHQKPKSTREGESIYPSRLIVCMRSTHSSSKWDEKFKESRRERLAENRKEQKIER